MEVTILGAGAMGSALSVPLSDNGHAVTLWGSRFDEDILASLRNGEKHPRLGVQLPQSVTLTGPDELELAVEGCEVLILGVSSQGVVPVTRRIASFVDDDMTIVSIAKGIVDIESDPYMIGEGIRSVLDEKTDANPPIVCVGGPSIASEVAERSRTAVAYAGRNENALNLVTGAMETDYYSIKSTTDLAGLQVCIGYKNAYSIALAWPDGITERKGKNTPSSMTNLKAILFLQTIDELQTLTRALNGSVETVNGLAGLGDLVTTSSGGRNGSFGRLIGSGMSPDDALEELEQRGVGVVEGHETADLGLDRVRTMVEESSLALDDLPLLQEINRVLYEDKPVTEAIEAIRF
ncbi:MAG: 2-dehydropantoate 2-reductase N-terminal domain-containing protein [bacterium]